MDAKVRKLINEQITHELHASHLYLAMAAHFEAGSWEGFAHWMRHQSEEEHEHAMKLVDHLLERGERVELEAIDAPPADFGPPLDAFRAALEHERKVTRLIHALYEAAMEAEDHASGIMLQWFVEEQVEEEAVTGAAVDRLERAGDDAAALILLDSDFGERSGGGRDT